MKPLLIIKTKNGFAAMEYEGEIPTASIDSLGVASELGLNNYQAGTLLKLVHEHFTPPPETPMARDLFQTALAKD